MFRPEHVRTGLSGFERLLWDYIYVKNCLRSQYFLRTYKFRIGKLLWSVQLDAQVANKNAGQNCFGIPGIGARIPYRSCC